MRLSRPLLFFVAAMILCTGPAGAAEQEAPSESPAPAPAELTQENIQATIDRLAAAEDIEEDRKNALLDTYRKALAELKAAAAHAAATEKYRQTVADAPSRLESVQSELKATPPEVKVEAPEEADLTVLQQRKAEAEAELAEAKKNLAALQAQKKQRPTRRTEIPPLKAQANAALEEVRENLAAATPEEMSEQVATARKTLLRAREKALQARIEALDRELQSYEATKDLLSLREDLAAQKVQNASKRVEAWNEIVSRRREKEAREGEQEAKQASREAARQHPLLQELAEKNQKLAASRTGPEGLTTRIEQVSRQLAQVKKTRERIEEEFKSIQEKVEAVGLSKVVGVLLLNRRAELPDIHHHRQEIRRRQEKISRTQFELIELEEQRSDLALLDRRVEEVLQQLPAGIEQQRREEIEAATRELLQGRRELLDSLISDYNTYLDTLADLDSNQRQLVLNATHYSTFIDRNVLWVQSHTALGLRSLGDAWEALQWMVAPENVAALARFLWRDVRRQAPFYGAFLLALALLLGYRRRVKRNIQALADNLHKTETDSIAHTGWALVLTLVRAAPAPLCLLFLGWRMGLATEAPPYVRAVGNGLWSAGVYWGVLAFLTVLCLRKGLMEAHFRMREEAPAMVRRHLHWFALLALPAIFMVRTLQWQPNEVWAESMGRFAFMAGALALAVFFAIVLRPNGAMVQALLRRSRGSWFGRSRYVWYALAVAFPAALTIAAGLGYYYSALQLQSRLRWSILLILGVLVAQKLTVRWLLLVRRRLAVERAQEKRAAAQERQEAGETEAEGQGPPLVQEEEEDLFALSMQTRRFLRAFLGVALVGGLWLIWSDVLPALGILRKVELWSVTAGAVENGQITHITLADILLAIIIFVLAVVAARNLPGILEMAVLQHLPIDRGVRFAISTLSRYTIVTVGVVLTATQIGIGWAKVQWLVAAMTVGLGFGLQEIFGNFISGLIILFERPMRVGDTVTVGDVFGTVTQIRIRATTIQQWDRKELIVPNKEFITGRLVNWTLSDTVLRLDFPVGIAYGSDIRLAEKRLLEVAEANERVMEEPPPRVVFKSFGDSSLLFELRLFVPDMESRLPTWHEVNCAIDDAFRESEITIAFPQQDVHLDLDQEELPVALHQQSPPHPGEPEQGEQNGQ